MRRWIIVGVMAALVTFACSSEPAATGSSPTSSPTPQSPTATATPTAAAPCDPAAMLPVIREEVDIGAEGVFWESVEIRNCQNGYARVFAIIGGTPPPGAELEGSEQVFLRDKGGMWNVLTSGSGIACSDTDLSPEMEEACRALGLL
jgi:hypothetical protein